MQFPPETHFREIVCHAIEDYLAAEEELTREATKDPAGAVDQASYKALRLGASAAIFLHHFSDVIATRPGPHLQKFGGDVGKVRAWLKDIGAEDIYLLRDTADALKHAVLNPDRARDVSHSGLVVTIQRGYGTGPHGEGKFGGCEEVWILAQSGIRSMTAVLTSVRDTWVKALAP